MSALLVDDLIAEIPVRTRPAGWRHVDRSPQARPHLVGLPGGRPQGVAAPRLGAAVAQPVPPVGRAGSWRLTDRGVAVVVAFFLAIVATAAVVLVGGFLAVSNAPVEAPAPMVAGVAARG